MWKARCLDRCCNWGLPECFLYSRPRQTSTWPRVFQKVQLWKPTCCVQNQQEKCKEEFILNRLGKKDGVFDPVPHLNLKTMADMHKPVKLATSNKKSNEYKQQVNVAFQLLVRSQQLKGDIWPEKVADIPTHARPVQIGLADDILTKTDKSKSNHYMAKSTQDSDLPNPEECTITEDGNAILHCMTEIPSTFLRNSRKTVQLSTVKITCDLHHRHVLGIFSENSWTWETRMWRQTEHRWWQHQTTEGLKIIPQSWWEQETTCSSFADHLE